MLDGIKKIWNNDTLYGHTLTTLPNKLWNFSTSDKLVTYTQPDPGTARRIFLIFEGYICTEKYPNGTIKRTQIGTNSLLLKYSEIGIRRIGGTFLTAGAAITAAPLGFAIKVIQNTFHKVIQDTFM